MKRVIYFLFLILTALCWAFTNPPDRNLPKDYQSSFTTFKLIPAIDTNLVVYSREGEPLKYYQYIRMLKTGKYTIAISGGKNVLMEVPEFFQKRLAMDPESIDARISALFPRFEMKSFSSLDTNIIVYDETGKALRFYQYTGLMKTGNYSIRLDKGQRYLKTDTASSQSRAFARIFGPDSIRINHNIYNSLSKADKVLVKKAERKMYILRGGKVIFEFPVNLGKSPAGAKQKEGDGRTPEGLYYLDYNIYADAAYYKGYHISYPNEKDSANAKKLGVKPGGDIMIHGTSPARSKLKDWTNGCIAISNAHIDTLFKYINNDAPIEIRK